MSSDQAQLQSDLKRSSLFGDLARVPVVAPRQVANNETSEKTKDMAAHVSAYEQNPLRFADGGRQPNFAIIEEKAEHRIMMYMVAEGKSNSEIAKIMGYGTQWVAQVKRQPWFKDQLVKILHEAGKDLVETFLQGEVLTSVETLVEIRDDANAKAATRVAAANAILDRALGKPVVSIKSESRQLPASDVSEEDARLSREIASIQEQLKASGGPN